MAQALWTGELSFGLVAIPVALYPAESREEPELHLLDRRDMSPVGYRKVNKSTGEEVPREDVVKGYEVEPGRYVVLTEEDLRRASLDKTGTIDIKSFVRRDEIDPAYFDRPFCLEPAGKSDKGYVLLREAMRRHGRLGVATFVLRTREVVAAVMAGPRLLTLNVLRYRHELRDSRERKAPSEETEELGIGERELKLAERLIDELSAPWNPALYRDTYRDDLLAFIKRKAESGRTEELEAPPPPPEPEGAPADVMTLLKRSVERAGRRGNGSTRRARRQARGPRVA